MEGLSRFVIAYCSQVVFYDITRARFHVCPARVTYHSGVKIVNTSTVCLGCDSHCGLVISDTSFVRASPFHAELSLTCEPATALQWYRSSQTRISNRSPNRWFVLAGVSHRMLCAVRIYVLQCSVPCDTEVF